MIFHFLSQNYAYISIARVRVCNFLRTLVLKTGQKHSKEKQLFSMADRSTLLPANPTPSPKRPKLFSISCDLSEKKSQNIGLAMDPPLHVPFISNFGRILDSP